MATRTDTGTTEADLKTAAEPPAPPLNLDELRPTPTPTSSSTLQDEVLEPRVGHEPQADRRRASKRALPGHGDAKVGSVTTRNVTPVSAEAQVVDRRLRPAAT